MQRNKTRPPEGKRRSTRLVDYDYSQPGAYFVTIRAKDGIELFGTMSSDGMELNSFGRIAHEEWFHSGELRRDFSFHKEEFVVMPNHIHGIVHIHGGARRCRAPTKEQFWQPVAQSLPTIVRAYKSAVTRRINKLRGVRGESRWQRGFHELIIRGGSEFANYVELAAANMMLRNYRFLNALPEEVSVIALRRSLVDAAISLGKDGYTAAREEARQRKLEADLKQYLELEPLEYVRHHVYWAHEIDYADAIYRGVDNPLTLEMLNDNDFYPAQLRPSTAWNAADEISFAFIRSLWLDPRHITNYEPVYFAELTRVYRERYARITSQHQTPEGKPIFSLEDVALRQIFRLIMGKVIKSYVQ